MKYRYQFSTEMEREELIAENQSLFLIEEQNITEGNFLVFSKEPISEKKIYTQIPEKEFEDLKDRATETENAILTLMDLTLTGGM